MFAGAEGVYEYGLFRVCPLTTPGVGVGDDILDQKIPDLERIEVKNEVETRPRGGALY